MTRDELCIALEKHKMWLNKKEGGERADLSYADLSYATLKGADLSYANLRNANLLYADLRNANLRNANLLYANLLYADLSDEEKYRLGIILKEPLIGYKKCLDGSCKNYVIVTLEIPKGAIVFSINGEKCRTNRAKVVEISEGNIALSYHSVDFQYKVGDQIEIDDFNLMYNVECASGIHFFKTREEAEKYEI